MTAPGEFPERYSVEAEIGRGASATVYRARDTVLQRSVALKIIAPALGSQPEVAERFEREAQLAARLDHPNIVTVYDAGRTPDGRPFIAMKLVEGKTLQKIAADYAPVGAGTVIAILGQVASAVDYLHSAGLIHRDLKPGNILVEDAGRALVADFGVAIALEAARLTLPGVLIGTPNYMAPEQVRGDELSSRTDIYALGVIAFNLLTGAVPFEGTGTGLMYKIVHEPPRPLAEFRKDLPPAVGIVIGTALAKDPAARYETAGAFIEALSRAFTPPAQDPDGEARTVMLPPDEAAPPPAGTAQQAPTPQAAAVGHGQPSGDGPPPASSATGGGSAPPPEAAGAVRGSPSEAGGPRLTPSRIPGGGFRRPPLPFLIGGVAIAAVVALVVGALLRRGDGGNVVADPQPSASAAAATATLPVATATPAPATATATATPAAVAAGACDPVRQTIAQTALRCGDTVALVECAELRHAPSLADNRAVGGVTYYGTLITSVCPDAGSAVLTSDPVFDGTNVWLDLRFSTWLYGWVPSPGSAAVVTRLSEGGGVVPPGLPCTPNADAPLRCEDEFEVVGTPPGEECLEIRHYPTFAVDATFGDRTYFGTLINDTVLCKGTRARVISDSFETEGYIWLNVSVNEQLQGWVPALPSDGDPFVARVR